MATIDAVRAETAPAAGAPEATGSDRRGLDLNALVGLVVTLAGLLIGLQRLSDNSFLTHLATGRLILDSGIPSTDPYSFSAPGVEWTVQSWLASALYAVAEELGGLGAVRLLMGLLTGLLAYLLWRLTAPAGSVVARAGLLVPAVLIGTEAWAERPLLFGYIGLAAVYLLADGQGRSWLAVPLFWVWVNTHGSFPLGVLLLVTLVAGRWLDRRSPRRELEVLGFAALGVLAGALNPLGPRLLVFPVELLGKSEVLAFIDEWRPPDYGDVAPKLFVLTLAIALFALLLRHRRFRSLLPLVVFAGLGLTSARNVAPAAIVALAAMAPAFDGIGQVTGERRSPVFRLAAVVLLAGTALVAVATLRAPATDLAFYPTEAVVWMEDRDLLGPDSRVISRDFVGNYLEARHGTDVPVFIDDRYDMYPVEVIDDYRALYRGDEDWPAIAERWDASAILWSRDTDLGDRLEDDAELASAGWHVAYQDDNWLVVLPD